LIAPETAKQYVLTEENGPKEVDRSYGQRQKYSDNVVVEYTLLMDKRMVILQMLKLLQLQVVQVAILVKDLNQTAIELEQSQAYQLCLM
jgi:hypothetical protein